MNYEIKEIITEIDDQPYCFDVQLNDLTYHYEPAQLGDLFTEHLKESFEFDANAVIIGYYGDDCKPLVVPESSKMHNRVKELVFKERYFELVNFIKEGS